MKDEPKNRWVLIRQFPRSPMTVYGVFNSEEEAQRYAKEQRMEDNRSTYQTHIVRAKGEAMKTTELIGPALDWAVAQCEKEVYHGPAWTKYSTDWAQGGPIIEREGISICNLEANSSGVEGWTAAIGELWSPQDDGWVSATPLIAAMRCYVASKLGDEVEVPTNLSSEV